MMVRRTGGWMDKRRQKTGKERGRDHERERRASNSCARKVNTQPVHRHEELYQQKFTEHKF